MAEREHPYTRFSTGNYSITSPQFQTNGSQLQYRATNNILSYVTGGGNSYRDFNLFLDSNTNGFWSTWVTIRPTTVSAANLNNNLLPATINRLPAEFFREIACNSLPIFQVDETFQLQTLYNLDSGIL